MPGLAPDLAEKALSADLRNLIKKIGDGGNLSPAERELIERFRAAGVKPNEIAETRAAALLRKFAQGGRLTKEELAEIAHWIPNTAPTAKRQTQDRYRKSLAHYAANFGVNLRTIKRWVSCGREVDPPDFPPFDEPQLLADWWRRRRKHVVPPEIEALELKGTPDPEKASAPTAPKEDQKQGDPSDQSPLPSMNIDLVQGVGADLGLQQAQALVNATFEQLQKALKLNRQTEAAQLRREWQQLVQILRSWEKDIIKIQEGRGEVLRTREINTELVRIFVTMGQSFFNGFAKLIADLAPEMPRDKQRELAGKRRDEIFQHLKGTRFESTWVPPADALK
jgi:hypothetical protein